MFKQLTKLVIAIFFVLATNSLLAQETVSIGTEELNENAVLQLVSSDKNQGFLVPKLTSSERASMALKNRADNGILVFDSDEARFYYWHNKEWFSIRTASDAIVETDPVFELSVAGRITEADTVYWNNKLDSYTETNPVFSNSIAFGITSADTNNWNNKFDSYTETDPVYASSIAYSISSTDTAKWNNGFASFAEKDSIFIKSTAGGITETDTNYWNHKLTSEVDGSDTNEIQNLSEVLAQGNDAGAIQIENIANPTHAQDLATKIYVDQMLVILKNNGFNVVDFTADNTTPAVGNTVNFTDNSAIDPTSWTWDFGDGNTSTVQNPSHTYITGGVFSVSLTASNGTITQEKAKSKYIIIEGAGAGVTDIDANFYPSIIIGEQEWMAENLKVTHYPNGDAIPLVTDNTAWRHLADNNRDDAYSYYTNSLDSLEKYGALYTYAAAIGDDWARDNIDNQGVCPDNWHLPSDAEWVELTDYLIVNAYNYDGTTSGNKIGKSLASTSGWNLSNIVGDVGNDQNTNNSSGFSALPGGFREGNFGRFVFASESEHWWCSTEDSRDFIFSHYVHGNDSGFNITSRRKSDGYPVRCVMD